MKKIYIADPVAPTIAIFSPFFMVKFMSFKTLLFFVYEKFTFSNFISPLRSFESFFFHQEVMRVYIKPFWRTCSNIELIIGCQFWIPLDLKDEAIDLDLSYFDGIIPCGLKGKAWTSKRNCQSKNWTILFPSTEMMV